MILISSSILSSIDVSSEPSLAGQILPFKILTLNDGRQVAIMASIPEEIKTSSSPGSNVVINRATNSTTLQVRCCNNNIYFPSVITTACWSDASNDNE